MNRLFVLGLDPVSMRPQGKAWPVHKTAAERIDARVAALPTGLADADRAAATTRIAGRGACAADADRGVRVRPDVRRAEVGLSCPNALPASHCRPRRGLAKLMSEYVAGADVQRLQPRAFDTESS